MSIRNIYTSGARALRRLLFVLARPAKRDRGRGGIVIQPYRGYGSREEIFLMGRVFRQSGLGSSVREGSPGRDLLDLLRRFLRWGVSDAVLVIRFSGSEQRVTTDRDGYFHAQIPLAQPPPARRLWHPVDLEVVEPAEAGARVQGEVFVPPEAARYVVISDIDDTVMYTGVANKAKMLWRLFIQGPRSRVAFPGVAAFYQALHRGPSRDEQNPLLYVSRGPWSIYELLEEFFQLHRIPVGPILFLREWGLTLQRPLPRRAESHKLELIREMLSLYRDLPFVLIGDSGQHDPEIYTQIVREHPGRVLATYIRNVTRDAERRRAIEALAKEVVDAGSTLLLAAESYAMAEHAVEHGLIPPETLSRVLEEREAQEDHSPLQSTRKVQRPTEQETREAVDQGELEETLERDGGDDSPPNVSVGRQ